MYPNLRAEIARKGMSLADVSAVIGRTNASTSLKLNGKNDFTLAECVALSRYFGKTIDELFEVADDNKSE